MTVSSSHVTLTSLFHQYVLLCSRQVMSSSFVTPWTVALQAPLSMEFPRQEYWNGLPFPPPGDLPGPGIEATSLCIGSQIFYHLSTWEAPLMARLILSIHSPVITLEHKP